MTKSISKKLGAFTLVFVLLVMLLPLNNWKASAEENQSYTCISVQAGSFQGEFQVTDDDSTWKTMGCSRGMLAGSKVKDFYLNITDPESKQGEFLGWVCYLYNASTDVWTLYDDTVLTTSQMLNYTVPEEPKGVEFTFYAQWKKSDTKKNISSCTLSLNPNSFIYDGKIKKPTIIIKAGTVLLKQGSDYTVKYQNNKDAGNALITITGTGNYQGTLKKSFVINKASNSLTVTSTSKTLKYNTLKTKAQKVTITASKAQGSVTYTLSNKKYMSVTSKGVVTFKKGTPKGTYKITVKAAGNTNYKSATKKATVKVK